MKKILSFILLLILLITYTYATVVDVESVNNKNGICEKSEDVDERNIQDENGFLSDCLGEEFQGYLGEIKPFHIYKGWNLVSFNLVTSQNFFYKDLMTFIDVEFALNPMTKEYFVMTAKENSKYKQPNDWFKQLGQIREVYPSDSWMFVSPRWIYSDKEYIFNIPFQLDSQFIEDFKEEFHLIKGWNLISINPLMFEKSFEEIKGNCNIDKAYGFDANEQKWLGEDQMELLNYKLGKEEIGLGYAIKVSENCKFDFSKSSASAPPSIPSN